MNWYAADGIVTCDSALVASMSDLDWRTFDDATAALAWAQPVRHPFRPHSQYKMACRICGRHLADHFA